MSERHLYGYNLTAKIACSCGLELKVPEVCAADSISASAMDELV